MVSIHKVIDDNREFKRENKKMKKRDLWPNAFYSRNYNIVHLKKFYYILT